MGVGRALSPGGLVIRALACFAVAEALAVAAAAHGGTWSAACAVGAIALAVVAQRLWLQ